MTTETDIEKRLRDWLDAGWAAGHDDRSPTYRLVSAAHAELKRRAQRISGLEYRERSRECVGGKTQEQWSVEGLKADLNSALDVIWRRGDPGARKWVRWNYPAFVGHRDRCAELRRRAQHIGDAVVGSDTVETPNWTSLSDLPPARPDAVQILRERAEKIWGYGNGVLAAPGEWADKMRRAGRYFAISESLRENADALEKERKG